MTLGFRKQPVVLLVEVALVAQNEGKVAMYPRVVPSLHNLYARASTAYNDRRCT